MGKYTRRVLPYSVALEYSPMLQLANVSGRSVLSLEVAPKAKITARTDTVYDTVAEALEGMSDMPTVKLAFPALKAGNGRLSMRRSVEAYGPTVAVMLAIEAGLPVPTHAAINASTLPELTTHAARLVSSAKGESVKPTETGDNASGTPLDASNGRRKGKTSKADSAIPATV